MPTLFTSITPEGSREYLPPLSLVLMMEPSLSQVMVGLGLPSGGKQDSAMFSPCTAVISLGTCPNSCFKYITLRVADSLYTTPSSFSARQTYSPLLLPHQPLH